VAQQQRGGDVGAVGKSHRDQAGGIQPVVGGSAGDEGGELIGAGEEVVGVEDAFGQAAKPPVRAPLADLAAG
jgi:hypothetical protein